jgi:hypothetical protein
MILAHYMAGAPPVPVLAWMLGSLDSFLVMMVIAAAGWIYNKVMEKGRPDEPPPAGPRPRPGESRAPAGPPVIPLPRRTPPEVPAPQQVPTLAGVLRALLTDQEPGLITTPLSRLDERVEEEAEAPARQYLEYARQREEKAEALEKTVAAEIAAVVPTPAVLSRGLLQPVRARAGNRELSAALRRPGSLRQLVLAAAILGPPKALAGDETQTLF